MIPAAKLKYIGNTWNEEKWSDCWGEWMVKQLYHPKFSFGIADLPVTQATKREWAVVSSLVFLFFKGKNEFAICLFILEKDEEERKKISIFPCSISTQHKRWLSRRLWFLHFSLMFVTFPGICIDLCLPISSLLSCVLKLKEMVKRGGNLNSKELKISDKWMSTRISLKISWQNVFSLQLSRS